MTMCDRTGRQHAERLEGSSRDCTPEQLQECHGEVEMHPCADESDDE